MYLIEIIKAIFLGVIEGITEWAPISSTGHMILADEFINLNMSAAFKEMFFVVIQLGAILAVVVLYWKKLMPFKIKPEFQIIEDTVLLWMKILAASVPAAVIGLLFDNQINEIFFNPWTVAITLILYGILFILIENRNKHLKQSINALHMISFKMAIMIGFFQMLALIPGTSRSGATIIGVMLMGASRTVAAEFTFFLAIPVMLGASALKILKFGFNFTGVEIAVLSAGMITAFIVSLLAIKFLLSYVKNHDFKVFGWYRIILGVVIVFYFSFFIA